jgi:hypothetical protein
MSRFFEFVNGSFPTITRHRSVARRRDPRAHRIAQRKRRPHAVLGGDIVPVRLETWAPDDTIAYLRREIGRADLTDDDACCWRKRSAFYPGRQRSRTRSAASTRTGSEYRYRRLGKSRAAPVHSV